MDAGDYMLIMHQILIDLRLGGKCLKQIGNPCHVFEELNAVFSPRCSLDGYTVMIFTTHVLGIL